MILKDLEQQELNLFPYYEYGFNFVGKYNSIFIHINVHGFGSKKLKQKIYNIYKRRVIVIFTFSSMVNTCTCKYRDSCYICNITNVNMLWLQ